MSVSSVGDVDCASPGTSPSKLLSPPAPIVVKGAIPICNAVEWRIETNSLMCKLKPGAPIFGFTAAKMFVKGRSFSCPNPWNGIDVTTAPYHFIHVGMQAKVNGTAATVWFFSGVPGTDEVTLHYHPLLSGAKGMPVTDADLLTVVLKDGADIVFYLKHEDADADAKAGFRPPRKALSAALAASAFFKQSKLKEINKAEAFHTGKGPAFEAKTSNIFNFQELAIRREVQQTFDKTMFTEKLGEALNAEEVWRAPFEELCEVYDRPLKYRVIRLDEPENVGPEAKLGHVVKQMEDLLRASNSPV